MYHYVYKLTDPETGEFYFGSRSCNCNPKEDKYMGSMVTWKPKDKNRLIKKIIKYYDNRNLALYDECKLIKEAWNSKNKLNRNYCAPGPNFGNQKFGKDNGFFGRKHTIESKIKMSKNINNKGENNGMYGKKHTKDTKIKMSELKKNIYNGNNNPRAKKLWQFDTQGNQIKIWDCAIYCIDHYKELKMSRGNISSAASFNSEENNKLKIRYGYYFSFNDISQKIKNIISETKKL